MRCQFNQNMVEIKYAHFGNTLLTEVNLHQFLNFLVSFDHVTFLYNEIQDLKWPSTVTLPAVAFFPLVGSAGVLKGGDDLVDSAVPDLTVSSKCQPLVVVNVAGTEGFLEGVFKTFLWCPFCYGSQWRVHHTGLSWAEDGPPFWRHTLPIVAVSSATWPLCWWFLPDQGPQH